MGAIRTSRRTRIAAISKPAQRVLVADVGFVLIILLGSPVNVTADFGKYVRYEFPASDGVRVHSLLEHARNRIEVHLELRFTIAATVY